MTTVQIILVIIVLLYIAVAIVNSIMSHKLNKLRIKHIEILEEQNEILRKYWKLVFGSSIFGTDAKQEKADENNQDSNENV